jgi:NADH:ubiquinone oxidoreductase subunit 3 (subunit A)
MGLIIALLVLWLVLIAIGFVFKALLWLAIVAIVLFIITVAFGVFHSVKRN